MDFIRSSMFGVLKDSAYFVNTLNFSFSIFSNPILKTVFEDELESESLSVAFQLFLKPSTFRSTESSAEKFVFSFLMPNDITLD